MSAPRAASARCLLAALGPAPVPPDEPDTDGDRLFAEATREREAGALLIADGLRALIEIRRFLG